MTTAASIMGRALTQISIKCQSLILDIIRVLFRVFFSLWFCGRKRIVPPVEDPVLLKSAVSLASDIREGKIRSEDVIKSYVARIREVTPYINAVCEERFEESLNEARNVDRLVASRAKTCEELQNEKPLLGIPFTVKIFFSVKGMHCNGASLLYKDRIALEDADAVALMKNAGAICLATTNAPEFGLIAETYNVMYGRTSNPYDTSKTAGGSSGGEGALIAAGGSLIGIGNDLAGSIRNPCHFNGVFGHKSTAGLISNKGMFPIPPPECNLYLITGPMCRYANDLVLATQILSGKKGEDTKFCLPVDFSKIKVYYILEDNNPLAPKVAQEVKDTVIKTVDHFKSTYKAEVEKVNIKGMQKGLLITTSMLMEALGGKLEDVFLPEEQRHFNPMKESLKYVFRQSKLSLITTFYMMLTKFSFLYRPTEYPEILNCFHLLEAEFNAILGDQSVLLMPSFSSTAHYHYEWPPRSPSSALVCIFNVLGLPVTQCPAGLSGNKLPLGLQVIGAKGQDPLTLAFALEIEKAFKGWVPPNNPVPT